MKHLQTVMQNTLYTCPTPLQASPHISFKSVRKSKEKNKSTLILPVDAQEAVAQGLLLNYELMGQPECYFSSLAEELEGKRDRMAAILQEAGMTPVIPEGGYFMLVDVTSLSELLHIHNTLLLPANSVAIYSLVTHSNCSNYFHISCCCDMAHRRELSSRLPLTVQAKLGHVEGRNKINKETITSLW